MMRSHRRVVVLVLVYQLLQILYWLSDVKVSANSNSSPQYTHTQSYDVVDELTYQTYTSHWIDFHEKWVNVDPHVSYCDDSSQSTVYPICYENQLVQEEAYHSALDTFQTDSTCPSITCIASNKRPSANPSSSSSCSYTPFDTVDYLPPAATSSLDSNVICNITLSSNDRINPNISSDTLAMDLGIPPLYLPVVPVQLDMSGLVTTILNEQCVPIANAEIVAWQINPTLLNMYSTEGQFSNIYSQHQDGTSDFSNLASAYTSTSNNVLPRTTVSSLRQVTSRATQHTSEDGSYDFVTYMPPSYGPPRHIMFQINAPGYKTLTTRVYFDADWRLQQLTSSHGDDANYNELYYANPINKDPRVAKLSFVADATYANDNEVSGFFRTKYNFVLSPVRPIALEPTTDSPGTASADESSTPPLDIDGLWADMKTGALVKVETHGSSFIVAEYPHARTWGTAMGVIIGNTIRGVDFKQLWSLDEIEGARNQVSSPKLDYQTSSTVWVSGGLSNGIIIPSDPFSTGPVSSSSDYVTNTIVQQPETMFIKWSSGDDYINGYNNIWTRQLQDTTSGSTSPQALALGFRYMKLMIYRETGGFPGGQLVINEIEFFEGILLQKQQPLKDYKMRTPRTPDPQRVSCSTFVSQDSHCYKAFDGDTSSNSAWVTKAVGSQRNILSQPQWINFDFGSGRPIRPTAMRIYCDVRTTPSSGETFPASGCPMTFSLLGSNDNQKFDLIYKEDLFDNQNDYDSGSKMFYFIFETAKGRVNGQQCGSCTSGPAFTCSLAAYDGTCDSRYCGATGLCDAVPPCAPGEYTRYGFTGYSTPAFQCKKCAAGRFGSQPNGKKFVSAACDGLCDPGYYCPEGSTSSMQLSCGAAKYFCPPGSPNPILAGAGRKTIIDYHYTGSIADSPFYRSAEILCDLGHYCVNGEQYPCPMGRYGDVLGLQTDLCSDDCEAGTYCPEGTVSPIRCPLGISAVDRWLMNDD